MQLSIKEFGGDYAMLRSIWLWTLFVQVIRAWFESDVHHVSWLSNCTTHETRENQMHVYMRVWPGDVLLQPFYDPSKGLASLYYLVWWESEVKVRYLDLKFMLRPNEVNLSKLITESICEVDGGWKLLQMSMDGPHVNWSVKIFMDKARAENWM